MQKHPVLDITGATVGENMPAGASVIVNTNTPGLLILVFFSATALPAGSSNFVNLQASVPATDAGGIYGKQQIVDIHSVTISDGNDNDFPVIADDAVHLASYLADLSGNGRINASDAAQVARVAALIDDGFDATPLTDPRIVGDVSGNGRVNAADASLIARFAALIDVPQIPLVPSATAAAATVGVPIRLGSQTLADLQDNENPETEAAAAASSDAFWGSFASQPASVDILMPDGEGPVDVADSENSLGLEDTIDELLASFDETIPTNS